MKRFMCIVPTLMLFVAADAWRLEAQEAPAEDGLDSAAERVLLAAPGGDTIASLWPAAAPAILEEEAEWVRVRVEGWIQREGPLAEIGAAAERTLGLAGLRAEPDRFNGQLVRWRVQFVGLQRADALRSDMPVGQRYLLVRDPGGEPGFVYAMLPAALLAVAETLVPLQRIELVARIRTGRSPLTGHPIVELVDIEQ